MKFHRFLLACCFSTLFSGCAVIAVADTAVSLAATAVKTTVKVGAAAVDLAIPDGKSEDEAPAADLKAQE